MVTKAIIQSINTANNRCIVRMPLFETAANSTPVEAEALVSITPGLFNNLEVGDIVFIMFEESAIEKPIIIGKLFRGAMVEDAIRGGAGILDTLKVRSNMIAPSSTLYEFPATIQNNYKDLNTPKKLADYIKWLERITKNLIAGLESHFTCFKNWTQWQLRPENVEIDDGDLDAAVNISEPFMYQTEGDACEICGKQCIKNNKRKYLTLSTDINYPDV